MGQNGNLLVRIAYLQSILSDTHSTDIREAIEGAIDDCRGELKKDRAEASALILAARSLRPSA
jgi:hypothetical protein